MISDLGAGWRVRANELERFAPSAAEAFRAAADELEKALQEADDELLSPAEAAKESGYSERRLRELRAEGKLKDHGASGRPRYRRGELPRRARSIAGAFDPSEHVTGIVT